MTVEESIVVSCNDVMMHMAAMEGKTVFKKYQDLFNFGSKTGIDLPGEADASSLVYRVDNMDSTSLATNGFGQNFNCTMVQMAAAFSSVINGGSYYEPHVVKQIINENGGVINKNDGVLVRETVSDITSRFIRGALKRTVAEGTGRAAQVEGYEIAGKTGTAEKMGRNKEDYLVSFCGYAPADNPQVLVYVVIDEPNVEKQDSSSYASRVFSQIMGDILPYLSIFPIEDDSEENSLTSEELQQGEGINEIEDPGAETEPSRPPFETDENAPPVETAEDGSPINSDLPYLLPEGAETESDMIPTTELFEDDEESSESEESTKMEESQTSSQAEESTDSEETSSSETER